MFHETPTTARSSFVDSFASLASADPDAIALIDGPSGEVTTREALLHRAQELEHWLTGKGMKAGDLIALLLPNSVDFIASFLAALSLRCTIVPLDRDARESEVAGVLDQFGARALIYKAAPADGMPRITVRPGRAQPVFDFPVALLKLTSGSTGAPKGIITTEENLVADCRNICATMDIRIEDRNFGAIPFSHSYGFSNLLTPLLLQGTGVVISNDYLPLSILDLANRFGCTTLPGIPMMYEHLSQLPRADGGFESMTKFISAGAPLSAHVARRFQERFGHSIHTFYGCSESGGIAYDREGSAIRAGSLGAPLSGVSLSLDPQQHRVIVRSDAVAAGYLNGSLGGVARFEASTFMTDDIGVINASGELELVGRVGDLINTAGKKVNPREVEQVLLQMEGIRQVRVYGEQAGARGEVVAAVVVADPDVSPENVRQYCRERLSTYKVPRIVKIIEQIPLDERGKVKRSELSAL